MMILYRKFKTLFLVWNYYDFIPEVQESPTGLKQWWFLCFVILCLIRTSRFHISTVESTRKVTYRWAIYLVWKECNWWTWSKKRNECDFVELKGSKKHAEVKQASEVDAFRKIRSRDEGIWLENSKGIPVRRGSYTLLNRFLMHWFCCPRGDIKKSGGDNLCRAL